MPRRIIAFVLLAVALAAVFVRLGFWQLDRLAQRRVDNANTLGALGAPESPIYPRGVGSYRRAMVTGTPDYANELTLAGRSRDGSPGVNLITPVRLSADTNRIVLVNRGWVYAADAKTVDAARWREKRATFHGYTKSLDWPRAAAQNRIVGHTLWAMSPEGVEKILPYRVAVTMLIARDSGAIDSTPARLPMPTLDDGPHLNYAIQWFSFAVIAIAGAVVVARKSMKGVS